MFDSTTLTRTLGGRWHGRYGTAACPCCQPERRRDQNALTVSDGNDGRLLLHWKKTRCSFADSLSNMTEEGQALIGGHSMHAENRLAACASFSAMWDGSPLDRWRAGDGVESHTGRRFSVHIIVQPVAAEALLSDPMANGQGGAA